jgi:chloride channel 7
VIKSIVTGFTFQSTDMNLLSTSAIGTFGLFWMFFAIMTYGAATPTGVFLFSIITGATVGQLYENTRINLFGIDHGDYTSLPLVIGAASMMASTTRLSYSIVVLMLEAANAFNLAIPMLIAVFVAKITADICTNSLYEKEIRDANLPVLTGSCPILVKDKKAAQIMGKNVITVTTIAEMPQI